MSLSSILRRRARHVVAPLIGTLVIAYFAYHAFEGDRGLVTYLHLAQEVRKAQITRDLIRSERDGLEKRVRLLRPDSMDPDMLEERARLMLHVGDRDDVVVMLQRAEPPAPIIAKP
jgi:cell division protein FtsB